ncbi:hypothetical protein Thal_0450 [Thermocrinis albus DSM 14484]|uniref:Uncharacterized protein n=1 Tax=Thermocrinis albus (strain DSM 14484 / JCM 11386 / HI 11/12) TaxID=638303 RepID=D3SPJ7_THEAH|nr:hypothetical protein [Thermocrinis albus]ADC89084.1 hypothetical protein Thal_0450 [Thermocrinis albus DSM 14484]
MKLQAVDRDRERLLELFRVWEEVSYTLHEGHHNHCRILYAHVDDESFDRLLHIFPSREEAMGAFLSYAQELGWEEFPTTFVVYDVEWDGNSLLAGIKTKEGVEFYTQTQLENMVRKMAVHHRVVVYSSDVLTYIKDIYPEVDSKSYVIARIIAKMTGSAPDLEQIARLHRVSVGTLEERLNFIEELVGNVVRLPQGELQLPSISLPLGCLED